MKDRGQEKPGRAHTRRSGAGPEWVLRLQVDVEKHGEAGAVHLSGSGAGEAGHGVVGVGPSAHCADGPTQPAAGLLPSGPALAGIQPGQFHGDVALVKAAVPVPA